MPDDTPGSGRPPDLALDPTLPGHAADEASGVARAGQVVAREEGVAGFNVIKLHAVSFDGTPTGVEIGVGRAGFNNHSPSVTAPWTQSDAPTPGVGISWIESATGDTSGVGRVMWQRIAAVAANDNATWVADHNGNGVLGCEPTIAGLAGGETLLTWIDADGNAHGRLYPPGGPASNGGADAPAYAAVNASLADLGPVASTTDGRRLQVTETRPGNLAIMWLALADQGFVLRGSMHTTPLGPSTDADSDGGSTSTSIADVRLPPGFSGLFSLQGAGHGSADVIVRYADASSHAELARRIAGPGADGEVGHAGPEFALSQSTAGEAASPGRAALADVALPVERDMQAQPTQAGGRAESAALVLNITGAPVSDPTVTAMQDGFAVTWETAGATDNAVAISMAMFDASGAPRALPDGSTVIAVADNALAAVTPSIATVGSGAAVSYVDAGVGSLVVKAYDGGGTLIGQDVVDSGTLGAVSEVALGSPGADPGNESELAVVYVRDDHDDDPDYGNILLQRYHLPTEEAPDGLVALGGDGQVDGFDAPVEFTNGPDAETGISEDVLGRAPAVTGLDDGELAIVWVEKDGARETIRGRVLEAGGGQVLQIDLTGVLQDSGIARGTEPILLANADGDILVSWLQSAHEGDDDAYVVMAALYESTGETQWAAPEQPMRLQEFDEPPKDFFVTWSDVDGTAIDVTWREDSSGSGSGGRFSQRFDLDGNDVGSTKKVPSDSDRLSTDGLSAAGLVGGQIVVVYTEQSSNGDLDLAAQVIDTQTGDTNTVELSEGTGSVAGIPIARESSFSTSLDQEIAINLPAVKSGATVSHVNGAPIDAATPVDVGSGWVQVREDGQLTISPNAGYTGTIAFDYTITGGLDDADAKSRVAVDVTPDGSLKAVALRNQVTTLADDVSMAADIKLADIAVSDADVSKDGLSLAGLDADLFKIVGTTLYLKAGIDLDFDTKPTLNVEVRADGPSEQDQSINFTLGVEGANGSTVLDDYLTADTFVFAPGFGEASSLADGAHEVIDMSSSGYSTFQELLDSGALVQAGEDVVVTLDPSDPGNSDRITLRQIDLSVLTSADFKF